MSSDEDSRSYQFGLTLEVGDDGYTLDITLTDVPRHHVPYMFSPTIADVITTTLMDMAMIEYDEDDEDDEDDYDYECEKDEG